MLQHFTSAIICSNPKRTLITKEYGINPIIRCESLKDIGKGSDRLNHYPFQRNRKCVESCTRQYHISSFKQTRIVHTCNRDGNWQPKFEGNIFCMSESIL